MRWMLRCAVASIALAIVCVPAVTAAGGGWSWPVAGEVLLEYGAQYAVGGATRTHGGLDIEAPGGSRVSAVAGGEVSFVGRVPAGEGAQAIAVSIVTDDGLRVTYLPLRSACVAKGARVGAGDALGALDSAGDVSSERSHLHLGVRRGETRLDPAAFLAAREGAPAPPPGAPGGAAGSGAGRNAPAPAGSGSQASAPAPHAAASAAGAPGPATLSDIVRDSAASVSSAIARTPALRRVNEVPAGFALNAGNAWREIRAGQTLVSRAVWCAGLALFAAACALPALLEMRGRAFRAEPAEARVEH